MLSDTLRGKIARIVSAGLASDIAISCAVILLRQTVPYQAQSSYPEGFRVIPTAEINSDPSLQAWLHRAYAMAPWPGPPTQPTLLLNGDNTTLIDVKVVGGSDGILINSGHNHLKHVEAAGAHSGINIQGPGDNDLEDIMSVGGNITSRPKSN
jgi:hypothetical protein